MNKTRRARWVWPTAVVTIIAALGSAPAQADRHQLWNLINLKCLRHLAKAEAPIPCDSVDISAGWDRGLALLKDSVGRARLIAVPTHAVTGIEDPALQSPQEPNYFAEAWAARAGLEWRLQGKIPLEAITIAVDSKSARDQDQLGLVMDCLDKNVAAAIAASAASLDDRWRPMGAKLMLRNYWARRIDAAGLSGPSPFRLLADGIDGAKGDMSSWSLALVQANFADRPGFILLADQSDGTSGGRATDLQDPACAVVSP